MKNNINNTNTIKSENNISDFTNIDALKCFVEDNIGKQIKIKMKPIDYDNELMFKTYYGLLIIDSLDILNNTLKIKQTAQTQDFFNKESQSIAGSATTNNQAIIQTVILDIKDMSEIELTTNNSKSEELQAVASEVYEGTFEQRFRIKNLI